MYHFFNTLSKYHFDMAAVWWFLASFLCLDVVLCSPLNPFQVFKKALEDEVSATDTIFVEEVAGNLTTVTYLLKDLTFSGKKNCFLENVNLEKESSTFSFNLECSHVEINADYKINGKISDLEVFGEGPLNLKLYDYVFMFEGKYEVDNEKQRIQIKDYKIDANPKSPVHFNLQNMYGDKKKSDDFNKYLNANWSAMDMALRGPTIDGYMGKFIINVNERLKQL